jgi:hypothetical protein
MVPHAANFAPVMAVAIFGGAVLPRKLAVVVPLAATILSDVMIGMYDWRIMASVWACYAIMAYASSRWLRWPSVIRSGALTVTASILFFTVTNFMVWIASGMYAHTWRGLFDCYTLALPFFRNTFVSDVAYVVLLFGAWKLARQLVDGACRRYVSQEV